MPFFTPNNPPDNQFVVRRILLPADITWTSVFDGMLLDLCYRHNWEEMGEMSVEDTADYFLQRYAEMTTDYKETPNSETPGDLDGTPQYPWYEQLYDWIIAGFLAITFTPNAAIVYQATVPKLRIAFRTGDIGALFRVLINGVEIWTGDSYAPIIDVLEQVFDTSSYETPYTVRIEHNGVGDHGYTSGKLEYIRNEVVADMVATILRADPEGCGVQWSTDDGGTWETIDLATCIGGIADDRIADAIEDGTIPPTGEQPSPASPPAPTECQSYHVALRGNDRWILPSPVSTGDSIAITNAKGGWSDGTLAWYCPDGARYLAGACSEELKTNEEGDPLGTPAYHMQLIATLGEDAIGPFSATPLVITGAYIDQPLVFQANDASLSDNSGQIEFDVEICSSAAVFCYEWDFRDSDGGWTAYSNGGNTYAYYSAGNGWGEGDGTYNIIRYDMGALREITQLVVRRSFPCAIDRNYWRLMDTLDHFVLSQQTLDFIDVIDGLYVYSMTLSVPQNARYIECFGDTGGSGSASYVVKYEVHGTGSNPIGISNCT